MSGAHVRGELGRGERILPGLWRLRLPLTLPGVPHCNAWAIQAGDGLVLVDCGLWEPPAPDRPGSMVELERAMAQVNLRLEQVEQLVITHAHLDHWGQAGPVLDRSGARLWLHPNHRHGAAAALDPEAELAHRLELARQGGVSEQALRAYAAQLRELGTGIARSVEPDEQLLDGVEIATDLGVWRVYETPGHAPSHICLHQPERRILISGDHLLGRISLYYDYGWTPDPIGEFLRSLDVVDHLDARLALSGHGRPFTDVHLHVLGTRARVEERLAATRSALAAAGPSGATALELAPSILGQPLAAETIPWRLSEALCLLGHLEVAGEIARSSDGAADRWTVIQA